VSELPSYVFKTLPTVTHTLPVEIALYCRADYILLHAWCHDDHCHSDCLHTLCDHVIQSESSADDSCYSSLTPTPVPSHTPQQVPSPSLPAAMIKTENITVFHSKQNHKPHTRCYHTPIIPQLLCHTKLFLHCTLASSAVYGNRSCLCVCVCGGQCLKNLTTASTSAVFASLWALFHYYIIITSCVIF